MAKGYGRDDRGWEAQSSLGRRLQNYSFLSTETKMLTLNSKALNIAHQSRRIITDGTTCGLKKLIKFIANTLGFDRLQNSRFFLRREAGTHEAGTAEWVDSAQTSHT